MFDHKKWIGDFLENPGYNDAVKYGVFIVRNDDAPWKVIGVHHLTPNENRGNHHIFIDALNESGKRVKSATIEWDWEGRGADEKKPNPLRLDKPVNEVPNLQFYSAGQIISIWHPDGESVLDMRCDYPDEFGPNGEVWNSIGHHSFFVVFQKVKQGIQIPKPIPSLPPDVPSPPPVQPGAMEYKFIAPPGTVTQHMNILAKEFHDGWIAYAAVIIDNRVHHFLKKAK